MPEAPGQARLAAQVVEEFSGLGQALPDLGQERGAEAAVLEDHTVDPRSQSREGLLLAPDGERLPRRQDRYLDLQARTLALADRIEARIAISGGVCVVRHVVAERAVRLDRADAAAQFALELERHEARTGLAQPRLAPGSRAGR